MFSHQYIKMCIEGKEDIEYIRIFNSTKGGWLGKFEFRKGDFFNHPKIGEDRVCEVAQVEVNNLKVSDDPWPYKKEDSTWIPISTQLVEEAQQMPFALHIQASKDYYKLQHHVLSTLSDEEQVLSYWMEHKFEKIWEFENQKWIKIRAE